MKLILLGPPGSGKGTVSEQLVKEFGWHHISPGELLREEVAKGTSLGKNIAEIMDKGDLVPDDLTIQIVKLEIGNKNHFVLDGFPRTLYQAEAIEDIDIDKVIYFDINEEQVIERLSGRRVDPETGRNYHLKYIPPPKKIKDRLIQREDDRPEAVRERFRVYNELTKPVIEFYIQKKLLISINAAKRPEEVYKEVKKVVSRVIYS